MYEAVHAYPHGSATAARFAATATDYGFKGLVVRGRGGDADTELAGHRPAGLGELRAAYDLDLVDAIEVRADEPASAAGAVGNYRPDHTLVLVRGGTDALNRFAVEQDRVDVLTAPFADGGDVNHVLARAAREHGVRIEFDLGPVLRASGGHRVRRVQKLRKLRELIAHYDAPFVVSAAPASHLALRAPRELRAVGKAIGFDGDDIAAGLREWGRLAQRNRDRLSPEFVAPGVRRGRHEDENKSETCSDVDGAAGGES